jgi:hypothetical protein
MKIKPLNVVQLTLMALLVALPSAASDWPRTAVWDQIAIAAAAGALGVVNLYAPALVPSAVVGPAGVQAAHIVQGAVASIISTIAGFGAANPALGPVVHQVSAVGGILTGVLGLFSPQAMLGPVASMRLHAAARAAREKTSETGAPPATPREGR